MFSAALSSLPNTSVVDKVMINWVTSLVQCNGRRINRALWGGPDFMHSSAKSRLISTQAKKRESLEYYYWTGNLG